MLGVKFPYTCTCVMLELCVYSTRPNFRYSLLLTPSISLLADPYVYSLAYSDADYPDTDLD